MAQQPQQQQPQQQSRIPMSQAQQMAVPMFTGQEKPFGWLNEIISRVMGQGPQPAPQPGQPGQPGQGQPQPQQGQQKNPGKQSQNGQPPQPGQAPGQPPVPGGMIDPSQAPTLANVIAPQALQNLGLMPQSQGDFGWVLAAMQHAQQMGAQQGGTNIAQILQKIVGGGSASGEAGQASGADANAGSAASTAGG